MIAAPSHDGTVNVWHASALSETVKLGLTKDINVFAIYMSFDSLVQRARNDLIKLAIEADVDDLVFIDTDQDWNPQDFFKLLEHDVDIVGVPVPRKSDEEQYNVKLVSLDYKVLENGLVEVDSVGTGMMRLSKRAIQTVWDLADKYTELGKGESRMVFDVGIVNGELYSEDVMFCSNWTALGEKIYIDPSINVGHAGNKRWIGDFQSWIKQILENPYE